MAPIHRECSRAERCAAYGCTTTLILWWGELQHEGEVAQHANDRMIIANPKRHGHPGPALIGQLLTRPEEKKAEFCPPPSPFFKPTFRVHNQ